MKLTFTLEQNLIELTQVCLELEDEAFDYYFYEADAQVQRNDIAMHRRLINAGLSSELFLDQSHYEHWRDNVISLKNEPSLSNDFKKIVHLLSSSNSVLNSASLKTKFIDSLQSSNLGSKFQSIYEEAQLSPSTFFSTSAKSDDFGSTDDLEPNTQAHGWSDSDSKHSYSSDSESEDSPHSPRN